MIYKITICFYFIAFFFENSSQAPLKSSDGKIQNQPYKNIDDISIDEINMIDSLKKLLKLYKTTEENNQEEVFAAPQRRQHWSYGFAPGGKKRSSPSLARSAIEEGLTSAEIYEIVTYLLENSRESKYPLSGVQARQHWSNSWQPGGKRSGTEVQAEDQKRQHWSFGYGPGGKRSFQDSSDLQTQKK